MNDRQSQAKGLRTIAVRSPFKHMIPGWYVPDRLLPTQLDYSGNGAGSLGPSLDILTAPLGSGDNATPKMTRSPLQFSPVSGRDPSDRILFRSSESQRVSPQKRTNPISQNSDFLASCSLLGFLVTHCIPGSERYKCILICSGSLSLCICIHFLRS